MKTLIGMLMAVAQGEDVIVLTHDLSPEYYRTEYESACGSMVFRVRFGSAPEERGRVDHLLIDGRPVAGAAETLQMRAASRGIESISIVNCKTDSKRPILTGVMNLSAMESRRLGMRWSLTFHLIRKGPESWRMTID